MHGEWDYEHFRENHLNAFLGMTEEFAHSGEFPEEATSDSDAPNEIG